ncbi:MAG: kynureninase [Sinobacteraceae bacterium]|nr:kynureninase [Nevskiaceae bacterium]
MAPRSRQACIALDELDPLAPRRPLFDLPPGVIYLDGNSLGALTHAAERRVQQTLRAEWGADLIKSWNTHDWIEFPARLGARIAPLLGAAPDEVTVCDSTSVNLFKIAAAAARMRGQRHRIVSERGNFPTDPYLLQGLTALVPGLELVCVDRDRLAQAIDEHTFLVVLTHVHYATAEMFDLAAVTAQVQAKGARILWDLSHSVGAVPLDLAAARADFAVGCTYKYLNGGPGAPAFMYVRRDLQADLQPVLSGWLGHARPFDFVDEYLPATGMARHRCGTPPILAFAALEGALSVFEGLDMAELRAKSLALMELFVEIVESFGQDFCIALASPRDAAQRGSHVSFAHPDGYSLMQQLIARGIIGDFRAPNLLRFGFTPLYLRYVDVWDAAQGLREELERWRKFGPAAVVRQSVT